MACLCVAFEAILQAVLASRTPLQCFRLRQVCRGLLVMFDAFLMEKGDVILSAAIQHTLRSRTIKLVPQLVDQLSPALDAVKVGFYLNKSFVSLSAHCPQTLCRNLLTTTSAGNNSICFSALYNLLITAAASPVNSGMRKRVRKIFNNSTKVPDGRWLSD